MRAGLKWIHYVVDPISYSYEAVLANEFHNLNLSCSPEDVVPRGPGYDSVDFQTCLLAGSTPRSLIVSGDAYLATSFDFHYSRIWYNLGIMAVQAVAFLVIGVVATEFLHFAPGGTRRIWARTKRVKRRLARQWYKDEEENLGPAFSLAPILDDERDSSALGDVDEGQVALADIKGSNLVVSGLARFSTSELTPRYGGSGATFASGSTLPPRLDVCSITLQAISSPAVSALSWEPAGRASRPVS